jgi:hypothetical protein
VAQRFTASRNVKSDFRSAAHEEWMLPVSTTGGVVRRKGLDLRETCRNLIDLGPNPEAVYLA